MCLSWVEQNDTSHAVVLNFKKIFFSLVKPSQRNLICKNARAFNLKLPLLEHAKHVSACPIYI